MPIKILFICHGNICRSPMAEFVMKDIVEREGMSGSFIIESAATTTEEIWNGVGNPVYPPARKKLLEHGLDPAGKRARLAVYSDYRDYDLIIGMDSENMYDMRRIFRGDPDNKLSLLMDYTDEKGRGVADPWYTRDFESTWRDVSKGCRGLFKYICEAFGSE